MTFQKPTLIKGKDFTDERGVFSQHWQIIDLENLLNGAQFLQQNSSFSVHRGTFRGMHAQLEPFAQGKLIRCLRGRILDVLIDIRSDSRAIGEIYSYELGKNFNACLYVPPGFLHGFLTLEDNTEITYLCTEIYNPRCEISVNILNIDVPFTWPIPVTQFIMSEKDKAGVDLDTILMRS